MATPVKMGVAPAGLSVTLSSMPTRKPRYMLTDTGDLSDLLDAAQRHWPNVASRKELLLRLAAAGAASIATEEEKRREDIEATAGRLTGVYEPDELRRLREDWPE
jgi:hypothetical protein